MPETTEEHKARLRELFPIGSTVFGVNRHRTVGGTNYVQFFKILPEYGCAYYMGYLIAQVTNRTYNKKHEAIPCRLNNGDGVVRDLASVLYGDPLALNYYLL